MITEGLLLRHCGKGQFRDAALIDVAQDHALHVLHRAGVFELGAAFKGGTALRKFRLGTAGRFSTDLDMAVSDADLAAHIFEELDGAEIGGFTFGVDVQVPNRRAILQIRSHLGSPTIPARIDIAHKMPWLEPEILVPLPMPVHRGYDIELTAIPVMRVEEVLAEKLARYRRHKLARDLYDLAWYSTKAFDEALVRRITVLKVWCDINDDGLGMPPFDPNEILASVAARDFQEEAIGYLTKPVDIDRWIAAVRNRFQFIREIEETEKALLTANRRDEWRVRQAINNFR